MASPNGLPRRAPASFDESAPSGVDAGERVGENTSGPKRDLVERLLQPPCPALLAARKARKEYVPRDRSCAHALLAALDAARGPLTKDELMAAAEATGIAQVSLYEKPRPARNERLLRRASSARGESWCLFLDARRGCALSTRAEVVPSRRAPR